MNTSAALGEVIRTRRQELGLTQEALAVRIGGGIRQAEVSRLESDKIRLPRRERMERIAAALGLSLGDLLVRSGWSGADEAFQPASVSAEPVRAPSSLQSPLVDEQTSAIVRAREARRAALQDAIDRGHETRSRTAELLQRSKELAASWNAATATPKRPSTSSGA